METALTLQLCEGIFLCNDSNEYILESMEGGRWSIVKYYLVDMALICTHEVTANVVTFTKPAQDQACQNSNIDGVCSPGSSTNKEAIGSW